MKYDNKPLLNNITIYYKKFFFFLLHKCFIIATGQVFLLVRQTPAVKPSSLTSLYNKVICEHYS